MGYKSVSEGNLKPVHGSITQLSTSPGGKKEASGQETWLCSARWCHLSRGKRWRKASEVLQDVPVLKCPSTVCWVGLSLFSCGPHMDSSFRAEVTGFD